jgi:hypothetical protein
MYKQFLTGAALALAAAAFGTTAAAGVGVATFEGQAAYHCDYAATEHDHGLSFAQDPQNPWYSCFYSPGSPADFPISPPSTVMAVGFYPFDIPASDPAPYDVEISQTNGEVFDFLSLDLAAGPFAPVGGSTFVTGFVHGGGTVTATLDLTQSFTTYALNWLNLDSVVFGPPSDLGSGSPYIAFDNVTYRSNAIPEPAEWVLMLGGLLASGYMLRRARQLAAVDA